MLRIYIYSKAELQAAIRKQAKTPMSVKCDGVSSDIVLWHLTERREEGESGQLSCLGYSFLSLWCLLEFSNETKPAYSIMVTNSPIGFYAMRSSMLKSKNTQLWFSMWLAPASSAFSRCYMLTPSLTIVIRIFFLFDQDNHKHFVKALIHEGMKQQEWK